MNLAVLSKVLITRLLVLIQSLSNLTPSNSNPSVIQINEQETRNAINSDNLITEEFIVNYLNYLDQYIKVPNSPDLPIWEIFTKQIKNKQFSDKIVYFLFYHYISSPISESFIAQLLLHRALNQKTPFFLTDWGNPNDFAYQLSANAL